MFDALKNIIGRRRDDTTRVQQERAHLERLLERFREERAAIDTMLTTLTMRTDEFRPLAASMEQTYRRATDLSTRLETIGERVEALDRCAAQPPGDNQQTQAIKDALILVRKGLQEFQTAQAEITHLSEKLDADRRGLQAFDERMATLVALIPELEVRADEVLSKLALVEETTHKTVVINERVAELNGHESRV